MSGLVRDIIERPSAVASSSSAALPPKPPTLSQSNGFPAVTHRSLKPPSAFIKARQERERQAQLKASGKLPQDGKAPVIKAAEDSEIPAGDVDPDEKQNLDRVRAMSPDEREQEKAELLDRFGGNLIGIMQKRRDKREKGLSKVIETAAPGPKGVSPECNSLPRLMPNSGRRNHRACYKHRHGCCSESRASTCDECRGAKARKGRAPRAVRRQLDRSDESAQASS